MVNKLSANEAAVVAGHLAKTILLNRQTVEREYFSTGTISEVETVMEDFHLEKIKIFSKSGEVVYSSDPENIGEVNKKDYLWKIVAKGNIYSNG